jgi:Carboxypeptidase regulatory-like domain
MNRKRAGFAIVLLLLLTGLAVWAPWSARTPIPAPAPRDSTDASAAKGEPAAIADATARDTVETGPADETEAETPKAADPQPTAVDEEPAVVPETPPPKTTPAVRRNPRDPPKPPPGSRSVGGGGGPRSTGLWEKFPPEIPRGRASVVVSVVDAADRPIPGADVHLGPPDIVGETAVSYAHLRKLGQTDAAGKLTATRLPEGAAAIAGNLNGLLNGRRGLDATSARSVTLIANKAASVTVRLPLDFAKMGSVRGVVRGADGKPVRTAQVYCGFFKARTDKTGRYEIKLIPIGEQTLSVQASSHRPASVPVVIEAGKTTDADIDLEYKESGDVSLNGTVLGPDGKGVPDVTVYVIVSGRRGGGTVRSARTDEGGRYAMESLPDRLYSANVRIQASRMGYRAANVTFPDGLTSNTVDLTLPMRMTRLKLSVLDAVSGEPQTRCRFEAKDAETGKRGAGFSSRSETGAYETWIAPGTYEFLVEAPDHEPHAARVVVPDEETLEYPVKLSREGDAGVEISLTVVITTAGAGEPVTNAKVEVLKPGDGTAVARIEGTRPDGRYRLPAPSGDWRLRVTAPDHEPVEETIRLDPEAPEAEVAVILP